MIANAEKFKAIMLLKMILKLLIPNVKYEKELFTRLTLFDMGFY